MRVGVIGVGAMGKHHVRVYSSMPGVELVGIADSDEARAEEIAVQHGTEAYGDFHELLEKGLDAVSIAVPTSMHELVALEAIHQGCSVLVEKPIAHTVASGRRIIDVAKEHNITLMVGHIERFNPVTSVMMDVVKDEDILLLELTRVGPFPPRIKDVGVVIDLGIHDIDLIRYVGRSEVKTVKSVTLGSRSENEDSAILIFQLEDGTIARTTTNWLTPFKIRRMSIATRTMFVEGDFVSQKVTVSRKYAEDGSYVVKLLNVPYVEPLKAELDAFIDSIKNGTDSPVRGEDGLKALSIASYALKQDSSDELTDISWRARE